MSKLLLAGLYFSLGLVYIILTGVDLPGKIDDFLHHHHSISYMIIGSIYIAIAGAKIYEYKTKYAVAEDSKDSKDSKELTIETMMAQMLEGENLALLFLLVFTLYCWKKLLTGKKIAVKSHKNVRII